MQTLINDLENVVCSKCDGGSYQCFHCTIRSQIEEIINNHMEEKTIIYIKGDNEDE